jgi:hypothetical protein
MSVEAKEATREKITQPRRLVQQTTDPLAAEGLRVCIEELEHRLSLKMGEGPTK